SNHSSLDFGNSEFFNIFGRNGWRGNCMSIMDLRFFFVVFIIIGFFLIIYGIRIIRNRKKGKLGIREKEK
ncbi:MAG: hypothetical protein ACFFE4_10960, partial [Candidatus Thorarchaeota archaeon]